MPSGIPAYLIQRGNNRQAFFESDEDHGVYAGLLKEYSKKYKVDIHAWVMMTNHVRLLSTSRQEGGISRMMQSLGRRYVHYFNYEYQRTGTLWEGRFKSCLVGGALFFRGIQVYRIESISCRDGFRSWRISLVQLSRQWFWQEFRFMQAA